MIEQQGMGQGLSVAHIAALEARGVDAESAHRHGLWTKPGHGGGDALAIPFRRDGVIVGTKYRTGLTPGEHGKMWQDKGSAQIFWNEDALRDDTLLKRPVVITEGEFDAIHAIQAGFARTVSVPAGAPEASVRLEHEGPKYNFLTDARNLLRLERAPEIILACDNDEAGAFLLHDLSIRLGRFRCKFLTYPKDPHNPGRRLKDLNEVWLFYGEKGVRLTLERAQWMKVEGVYRMGDLPPVPPSVIYDIGFPKLRDHFKIRLGDFIVVTGIPSMGKTTWVNDLCCRLAIDHRLTTAFASFEQSPQKDHRRALRSWYWRKAAAFMTPDDLVIADAWIDKQFAFMVPGEDDDVTIDWLLDRMEAAVVQFGAKVIVVDPWNEMDHTRAPGESVTDYTGRAIKAFRRFARKFQIALIVVAHPTKQTKLADGTFAPPTLYDISDCYSADTEVLTRRGWLRHDKVSVADDVMGFDPGSGALNWAKPERVVRHRYRGDMVRFKGYGLDLLVSPNHRMVTKPIWDVPKGTQAVTGRGRPESRAKGVWSFMEAREFTPGMRFKVPKAGNAVSGDDPDQLLVQGVTYPAAEFCELVGWWVAEGSFVGCGATLCQADGTTGAERIDHLISACGLKATRAVRNDPRGFMPMVTWYLGATCNRGLVAWLRDKAGAGSENKKVPYPFFSLSPRLKVAFLNGYIAGDGHRPTRRDGFSATTTSRMLWGDLQRLAVELGIPVTGRVTAPVKACHAEQFSVNFGRDERREVSLRGHRHVGREPYDGDIWCLTVPTGAYVVRRNGAVVICGNSAHWYNKADVGIVVHRDDDGSSIRVSKSRYHEEIGTPGQVRATYLPDQRRFEIWTDEGSDGT